jgi:hypothetical protein
VIEGVAATGVPTPTTCGHGSAHRWKHSAVRPPGTAPSARLFGPVVHAIRILGCSSHYTIHIVSRSIRERKQH